MNRPILHAEWIDTDGKLKGVDITIGGKLTSIAELEANKRGWPVGGVTDTQWMVWRTLRNAGVISASFEQFQDMLQTTTVKQDEDDINPMVAEMITMPGSSTSVSASPDCPSTT